MGLLKNLFVRVKGDSTHLQSELKTTQQFIAGWARKIAGLLGVAFGVSALTNFAKEASKLAATAEGIAKGFQQIAKPGLLDELRKATAGTVTDMQLMSRAVQASNFQIPLEQLGKLLQFASARAIQTGQSVDYLVDSIVLGIGRKSPLILDNLGISAVRLRELLKGPGVEMTTVGDIAEAVGKIATEELSKMGGMAETTAVKTQQIGAAWTNIKTGIGTWINQSKVLQGLLTGIASLLDKVNGSGVDKFAGMSKEQLRAEKERLEAAIRTDGLYVNELVQKKESLNLWQKLKREGNDIEDSISATGKKIGEYKDDIAKINELLSFIPPKGSVGDIVAGRSSIIAAPSQGTFGQLKVPGISGLEGAQGLQPFNAVLERDVSKMEEILTTARDMAVNYGSEIVEALGEALTGGNLDDIGKSLLMSLANFLSQFGKMLIVMGLGIEAYVKSLATLNPFMAVAAGVAMLLAAGAIKGIISRQSSSVSSGRMGGGSGGYGGQAAGQMKVVIEGKLVGRDIYWSNKRYETDLNSGT